MGFREGNGKALKGIPDGETIPAIVPEKLFMHNIKEFSNLASILPSLYAEEKDNM